MRKAAGILSIIGGVFGIVNGLMSLTFLIPNMLDVVVMEGIGGGLIALGIVALIGGICTLNKKVWGMGLTGAICAIPCAPMLGVLSIIFVSVGKKDFS